MVWKMPPMGTILARHEWYGGLAPAYSSCRPKNVLDGKPCIPTPLQREWIRTIHEQIGHVGFERPWKIFGRDFEWAMFTPRKILQGKSHTSVKLARLVTAPEINSDP